MSDESHATRGCFLPGTLLQTYWDSTSLGAIKTCPRYYYYNIICGYIAKDENIHLRFGQEYHKAIEDFEMVTAQGYPFDEALRETIRSLLLRIRDWDPDVTTKAGTYKNPRTLLQLVVDYFDNYRNDAAKTIILESGRPAVELTFKFELDFGPVSDKTNHPYVLCGHLDRVVTINDNIFVVDHKTTTSTLGDYWFSGFNPNNQMTLYTFAGQVVMDMEIKGVCIEGAQIGLDKFTTRFARGFTYRNDELIDEWLNDLEYWLNSAEAFAEAKHWPMNDTSCGMYGGCRYRDVCAKSPNVREIYLKSDFIQLPEEERWDPTKAR